MRGQNRTYANRGAILERLLDITNKQYLNTRKADVKKIPTPVKILNVTGSKVSGTLTKGEFTDYIGISNGRSIVFDAKETKQSRFPLKNLHDHQYRFLKSWHEQGAAAFLIVSFATKQGEIYYLPFESLQKFWEAAQKGGQKSIPYKYFVEQCSLIKSENGIVLDYLKYAIGS